MQFARDPLKRACQGIQFYMNTAIREAGNTSFTQVKGQGRKGNQSLDLRKDKRQVKLSLTKLMTNSWLTHALLRFIAVVKSTSNFLFSSHMLWQLPFRCNHSVPYLTCHKPLKFFLSHTAGIQLHHRARQQNFCLFLENSLTTHCYSVPQ